MELRKEDIQVLRTKSRATSQVTFDVDYNVPDVNRISDGWSRTRAMFR